MPLFDDQSDLYLARSQNLADLANKPQARSNLGVPLVDLGGKRHTRSSDPPDSPAIGDTWDELDLLVSGIKQFWVFNGTYWLSKVLYQTSEGRNVAAGGSDDTTLLGLPIGNSPLNLFLLDWSVTNHVTSVNDASNHWKIELVRNGLTSGTLIAINTAANAINAYVTSNETLNLHLNISTLGLKRLVVIKSRGAGSPGFLRYGSTLSYRFARP